MLNNRSAEAVPLSLCFKALARTRVPIVFGIRIAHSDIGFDALCPFGFASRRSLGHVLPNRVHIAFGLGIVHSDIGFDALCPCGFASRSSLGHVLPNGVHIAFCASKCLLEP